VEDEANEIPASEPKLPGMNSFMDIDDDDDDDGDGDGDGDGSDSAKSARGKPDRGATPRTHELPPYDTSSPTNLNFSSEIIGMTVRPGAFLSLPEELEDDSSSSQSSSSDSDLDFPCSPYDGISTSDSELDFSCSPYDGIVMTPPRLSSSTRRYGVADMAYFAQGLKDTIPKEGYDMAPTISRRTGLLDVSNFVETDPVLSCGPLERLGPLDDELTISNCDIGIHDSRDGLDNSSSDADTLAAPHEGLDLMRRLLEELRDSNLDCAPRPLSEDSDSECSDDDEEEEAGVAPWLLDNVGQTSLESTSTPGSDSDVSDEGPIYPLTPPPIPAMSLASAPDIRKDRPSSPVTPWSNEQVLVMPPTSSNSPPLLPAKVYVRSHRDSRLLYGPRVPLVNLPRL
jgi:hypothetical protein